MRGMGKSSIAKNSLALQLRSLYNAYIAKFCMQQPGRIPKIIHQIWLGSPLPERYKQWQRTWTDNHPDW